MVDNLVAERKIKNIMIADDAADKIPENLGTIAMYVVGQASLGEFASNIFLLSVLVCVVCEG